MGLTQADPAIFVPELDDDYSRLLNLDEDAIVSRVNAYFLLAPSLLLHPAYAFQSRFVNSLISTNLSILLRPPYARAAVGDSAGWNDYLCQRIDRLTTSARERGETTEELNQYRRWGDDLHVQARRIDAAFPDEALWRMNESRDGKFRRLLRADLSPVAGPGSLTEQLAAFKERMGFRSADRAEAAVVDRFVTDADLVSMETVLTCVRRSGLGILADDREFRRRLLNIYYSANVDDSHVVPGLAGLSRGQIVDPYDADVFWAVFGRLFGTNASQALATAVDPELLQVLRALKERPEWQDFRLTYVDLMKSVDSTLRDDVAELVARLQLDARVPEKTVLARFWRQERKWIALELVATILSGIGGGIQALAAGAGVSFAVETIRALPVLRRFVDEYNDLGIVGLRDLIGRKVRIALDHRSPS